MRGHLPLRREARAERARNRGDGRQEGDAMTDAERLAAYDAFAGEVRAELADTAARMDALRAENKVKTATYRQLFAARVTLKDIVRRLEERGL